jgi:ubiquinone/menaquinone biosynthesis C-methylase UbiE
MSVWGRIFAAMYDRMMASTEEAGLGDRRQELLANARGSVIEIGAGTGVNLQHYVPGAVQELVLVEPEEPMARRLERKLAGTSLPGRVVRAPAEALPLPDASFDVAVSTLVLCTVGDQARALAEVHRVLKPDGQLLFIEHVRAEDPRVAKWQDRLLPLWVRCGHGCHCNRPTLQVLSASGFDVRDVERGRLPKAPPIVRPMIAGVAVRG